VCAHPAVDAAARAPLMLQTVLGLDAARMAGAFLTAPSTLGQRLVRAKARIRAAGIPFEYPQARDLPQRLQDVLDGIYAAYGTGWDDVDGADALPRGLTTEAIDLCRILCGLMPDEPEPLGLLALMLFCEARMAARRSDTGAYVP
ncbi:RNA polymerase subunit sigma-70, partial [Mycobacterium tuberculosis]